MDIKNFTAKLIKVEGKDAGYIEIPFDVEKEFGAKRVKVLALLDGVEYRGSLVRMQTPCHILGVTKEIRRKMGRTFGDVIAVSLSVDSAERRVELPEDFAAVLAANEAAQSFYAGLSYTNQKKYVQWIESAKKQETRTKRLQQAVCLLQAQQLK